MGYFAVPVEWITCTRMACSALFFLVLSVVTMKRRVLEVFKDVKMILLIAGFAILGITLTQISYLNAIHYAGAGTALLLGAARARARDALSLPKKPPQAFSKRTRGVDPRLGRGRAHLDAGGHHHARYSAPRLDLGSDLGCLAGFLQPHGRQASGEIRFFPGHGVVDVFGLYSDHRDVPALDVRDIPSAEGWVVFALIVFVGTILAYLLFRAGIKDAVRCARVCSGSVEPVSAIVISAVWLNTPISLYDALGAVAIVSMIALVTQREEAGSKGV